MAEHTADEIRRVLDEELPPELPLEDRLALEVTLLRLEIEEREREIRVLTAELRRDEEIDELEAMFEG